MQTRKIISILSVMTLVLVNQLLAQPSGQAWSKNVALLAKSNWGHGGAPNVWGWRNSQSGKDYALVTYVETGEINIVTTSRKMLPFDSDIACGAKDQTAIKRD